MNSITHDSKTPPHVAVISFPMGSHPSTLFTVAKIFASSAPLATFSFLCSPKAFSSLSQQSSQFQNLKLCNGLKVEEEKLGDFLENMISYIKDGISTAVEELGLKATCLVSDGLMSDVGKIAREMNVPWIPVRCTGPAKVLSHFYYKELIQAYVEEEKDKPISSSICPSLSFLKFKDLPDFMLLGVGDGAALNPGTLEEFPKAAAVVLNTFEGLNPQIDLEFKSKFKKYLPIGPTVLLAPPPPASDDDKCMAWLDRHSKNSVVYICFGTYNSPSKQELAELAGALLEVKDVSFMWSLPEKDRKELPDGFEEGVEEERGLLVKWAPQSRVLKHDAVGAFLTHGGWNSVMEGIAGGVPMICRPFRWDQMSNVRMVTDLYGVGIRLDEEVFRKREIVRMLRMMMLEEAGEQMRGRAGVVQEMAEAAAAPDGSSSRNLKSVVDIMYGKS